MSRVGYARVSTTGQSLDVQLKKLNDANCDRIYQEKRSGRTANRPAFKDCMNYLREGDSLVVTKLDRLARSVLHLAQLGETLKAEGVDLVILDQDVDTSSSSGKLMFNLLALIAEFENDLRTERQAEGIAKAKENGVRFGRPPKVTNTTKQEIYSRRLAGATIGQLAKEFKLGEATIYRALAAIKHQDVKPEKKTTKLLLWLDVENNSKFVRGKGKSRRSIEDYYLSRHHAEKVSDREYELTFQYVDDDDLEEQINDLIDEMHQEAEIRNGFIEYSLDEIGTECSW